MVFNVDNSNSPFLLPLSDGATKSLPLQDVKILVDTSQGAVTILLPATSNFPVQNVKLFIIDISGNAGTNNITITASGGEVINNLNSYTINTDLGFARVYIGSGGQWTATGASVGQVTAYKVYTALLTQTGTNAPVATVLENTIGDIVWTRVDVGEYLATLSNAFTIGKTFVQVNLSTYVNGKELFYVNANGENGGTGFNVSDVSNIGLISTSSNQYIDDILLATFIEIRVYN